MRAPHQATRLHRVGRLGGQEARTPFAGVRPLFSSASQGHLPWLHISTQHTQGRHTKVCDAVRTERMRHSGAEQTTFRRDCSSSAGSALSASELPTRRSPVLMDGNEPRRDDVRDTASPGNRGMPTEGRRSIQRFGRRVDSSDRRREMDKEKLLPVPGAGRGIGGVEPRGPCVASKPESGIAGLAVPFLPYSTAGEGSVAQKRMQ